MMAKNHAQSPAGPIRYNGLVQVLRALAFVIYMLLCSGMSVHPLRQRWDF